MVTGGPQIPYPSVKFKKTDHTLSSYQVYDWSVNSISCNSQSKKRLTFSSHTSIHPDATHFIVPSPNLFRGDKKINCLWNDSTCHLLYYYKPCNRVELVNTKLWKTHNSGNMLISFISVNLCHEKRLLDQWISPLNKMGWATTYFWTWTTFSFEKILSSAFSLPFLCILSHISWCDGIVLLSPSWEESFFFITTSLDCSSWFASPALKSSGTARPPTIAFSSPASKSSFRESTAPCESSSPPSPS